MVNITALEQIHRLILNENLITMKNWDLRYKHSANGTPSSYFRKIVKRFRNILNILSGVVSMLTGNKYLKKSHN